MTNQKYSGHSVEELLEDKDFVALVKSIQSTEQWDQLLEQNHDSRQELIKAKEVIDLFSEKSKVLDAESKDSLWRDIQSFDKEYSRKHKLHHINRYLKIAASFLLVAAIGSLAYLYLHSSEPAYQFSEATSLQTGNPLLIMSNGKQVDIQKTDPNITVLKDQNAIQVDNDSILTNQPVSGKTDSQVQLNEIIVPFGKRTRLLLSDGTKVWLNAGSRLAFPQNFEGKKREVFLEGEAIFEVAKRSGDLFLVNTRNFVVNVTGTVFNVTAYADDALSSAVLAEGKIELTDKGSLFSRKTVHLLPGTKVVYDPEDKSMTSQQVDPNDYLSWREGFMVIHGENLQEILKKLARYYNVKMVLEDQAIAAETFSGRLDLKDSPREVLTVISRMVPLSIKELDNKLIIKQNSMSE
ncbi:MAG: FecR family protein [Candidatus Saccharibacteria bacterium]